MNYKMVSMEIPVKQLDPCIECGCDSPVMVKILLSDGSFCWKVFCPVCGKQTFLYTTGEAETGDMSAIRDWNHDKDTPNTAWSCPSCKAVSFGKYYKFCPYCGTKRR